MKERRGHGQVVGRRSGAVAFALLLAMGPFLVVGATPRAGAAGPNWTVTLGPTTPGGMVDVSCTSWFDCTAVGQNIQVWDGTAWNTVPSPGLGQNGTLEGVSCQGPAFCAAVGDGPPAGDDAVAELWDGGSWSLVPAPNPTPQGVDARNSLQRVSCTGPDFCLAAGFSEGNDLTGVLDRWNGRTWSLVASPAGVVLLGVSCTGPTFCMVTGFEGLRLPVAFTWNGSQLTNEPLTDLSGDTGDLAGVDCLSPTQCTAVGQIEQPGTDAGPDSLIEHWDGTAWTRVPSPDGPAAGTGLRSVACSSPQACTAVGADQSGPLPGGATAAVIESWDGRAWTVDLPAVGTPQSALQGVSCLAAGCVTAGDTDSQPSQPDAQRDLFVSDLRPTPAGTYREAAADGGLFAYGAPFYGSMGGRPLTGPVVGLAGDPLTGGYREVAADGGIFSFHAPFEGSMGGRPLNAPIVGMATDPATGGYWEVASDGGLFAFDAPFLGSMGGRHLNAPIVGMAPLPDGSGYRLVARDGGVFSFHAPFEGSMGGRPLNAPIVAMATDPVTGGYWMAASDGGLFAFDAPFLGLAAARPPAGPVVGVAPDPVTGGYWLAGADGTTWGFGAPVLGPSPGPLRAPLVGVSPG